MQSAKGDKVVNVTNMQDASLEELGVDESYGESKSFYFIIQCCAY